MNSHLLFVIGLAAASSVIIFMRSLRDDSKLSREARTAERVMAVLIFLSLLLVLLLRISFFSSAVLPLARRCFYFLIGVCCGIYLTLWITGQYRKTKKRPDERL